MPTKRIIEYFQSLLQIETSLSLHSVNHNSCQERLRTIKNYAKETNPFSFYLITNPHDQAISWSFGMQELLGYKDVSETAPLPLNEYFQWIHEDHIELYVLYGLSMYNTILNYPEVLMRSQFQYYGVTFAIKHKTDNHYVSVFQRSLPFEIGENNELISHLNIYNVLGVHRESERLIYPLFKTGQIVDTSFQTRFYRELKNVIEDYYNLSFSKRQSDIISLYIERPDCSVIDISERLGHSTTAIKNSQKAILKKLNRIYHLEHLKLKDVIYELRKLRLLILK